MKDSLSVQIEHRIYLIRGHKVMLDADLAELYGVQTKMLNRAVKRNLARFPDEFMFRITAEEAREWKLSRRQNGTMKRGQNIKYLPLAFTEHGVAMLSSILNSPQAIQVNIAIIKTFVRLREFLAGHADLVRKLDGLEQKYDHQFKVVFDAIRQLMIPPEPPRKRIGFRP